MFLLERELSIREDLRFMVRENMVPAMLGEYSDGSLRFADNMERVLKLDVRTVHQFNAYRRHRVSDDSCGTLAYGLD